MVPDGTSEKLQERDKRQQIRDRLTLYGMDVFVDPRLTVRKQIRFPRSKKKRIRKKWAKRPENWATVPDPNMYMIGSHSVVMTPEMFNQLAQRLADTDMNVPLHMPKTIVAGRSSGKSTSMTRFLVQPYTPLGWASINK